MKLSFILLIVFLIILSSTIAYLSPSVFGHQSDVIGVNINSEMYSFQDLISSNYLLEKTLPQSTISSFSHNADEITVRSVDGNVKVLSEALNDNFNIKCEFRADSLEPYDVLTNPGHSGYEISLNIDSEETTIQEYINSEDYCYNCEVNDDDWCGGCKYDYVFLATDGPGSSHIGYFTDDPSKNWIVQDNIFSYGCSHSGCFPFADTYFNEDIKEKYVLEGKEISYIQNSWVVSNKVSIPEYGLYERKVLICGGFEEPAVITSGWDQVRVDLTPAYYQDEYVYYKYFNANVEGNSFGYCGYSFCARFDKSTGELIKKGRKECKSEGSLAACALPAGIDIPNTGTVYHS